MGSIGIEVPANTATHPFVLRYLRENLAPGRKVVAHNSRATGGSRARNSYDWTYVLYAAVAEPDSTVSAHVVLYKRYRADRGRLPEIFIKHLHESEGPVYFADVSLKVLDALTPTDHDTAAEWRASARKWHADNERAGELATRAVGALVRLATPLRYPDPVGEVQTVWVVSPTLFRAAKVEGSRWAPQLLAAPERWALAGYSILPEVDGTSGPAHSNQAAATGDELSERAS